MFKRYIDRKVKEQVEQTMGWECKVQARNYCENFIREELEKDPDLVPECVQKVLDEFPGWSRDSNTINQIKNRIKDLAVETYFKENKVEIFKMLDMSEIEKAVRLDYVKHIIDRGHFLRD